MSKISIKENKEQAQRQASMDRRVHCPVSKINHILDLTTVYKAGLSTAEHLYNLGKKNITKYPVLTTYKIPKNSKKKHLQFFEKNFRRKLLKIFFKKLEMFFLLFFGIL